MSIIHILITMTIC